MEAFDIFSQGGDLESCGLSWNLLERPEDLFDFEPDNEVEVLVVRDVTDVQFCDGFSCCSDWEFMEPQSFPSSKKRAHSCTDEV